MNPATRPQTMLCKKYSEQHVYLEKVVSMLCGLEAKVREYEEKKIVLLSQWQFKVLKKTMQQGPRTILWVVDPEGNRGKSFLATFMSAVYGFSYLDGLIPSRDMAALMPHDTEGIVYDVSRAAVKNFHYAAAESLKNGLIVSGKYRGKTVNLKSTRTVVFSNSYPETGMMSMDRWEIVTLGMGDFADLDPTPLIDASRIFPYKIPVPVPDLSENFDIRQFLELRVGNGDDLESAEENPPNLPRMNDRGNY